MVLFASEDRTHLRFMPEFMSQVHMPQLSGIFFVTAYSGLNLITSLEEKCLAELLVLLKSMIMSSLRCDVS